MLSESPKRIDHSPAAMFANGQITHKMPHPYLPRFIVLGVVIVLLAAVVLYLYQSKIGVPMAHWEQNAETELVTEPLTLPQPPLAQDAPFANTDCPAGTNRVIYIDGQALCCKDTLCKEPDKQSL